MSVEARLGRHTNMNAHHPDHSRRLILTLGFAATLIALLTAHPDQDTRTAATAPGTAEIAATTTH